MRKFGVLLNGRPAGREAALRVFQIVNGSEDKRKITLDFAGIEILTPSFADEFLELVKERYGAKNVQIENTETPEVRDTVKALESEPVYNASA